MNTKKIILFVAKITIVFLAVYYLVQKLRKSDWSAQLEQLNVAVQTNESLVFISAIIVLFTLLNWYMEAYKWKYLATKITPTSFKLALDTVLTSLAMSIFTPNRIGEFGARTLHFKPEDRAKGLLLTFVGNLPKMYVNGVFGFIGMLYFLNIYIGFTSMQYVLLAILIGITIGVGAVLYFIAPKWLPRFAKARFVRKLKGGYELLNTFTAKDMLMLFVLSTVRYLAYTIQYYLLLRFFGIDIPIGAITLVFIFQLLVISMPIITLFDLVVRSSAALFIFGYFYANDAAILAAGFFSWALNFGVPLIIGCILLLRPGYSFKMSKGWL